MTKRREKTGILPFASAIALLLILSILNLSVSALDISGNFSDVHLNNLNNSDNSNSTCKGISIYFFYGEGCAHCAAIEPMVKAICTQCDISFKSYEVYHNATNQALLNDFMERYCIPANESGVPAIFVGDSALIGDESIAKNLKDAIKFAKQNDVHAEIYEGNCTVPPPPPVTILTVIGAAIIDSINPCAMGVLIIFITFMISSANFSRRRMAIYGSIYIMAVYLTYFLAGIGILKFLNFINNLGFIIFVNALVVIILLTSVLLAFRDTYISLKKNGEKNLWLAIPKSAKGTVEKYIKKGTLPAVIILGILVAMVELPCTGQVYLGILTILNTMDFNYGILLLAIYNFIFVLPLIIILSLALFGRNLSKIEETWLVRYLIGWLMLILAIILINENFKFLNFSIVLPVTFSYAGFFIFASISIIVLFILFSILRPIVKKRINIWYCAYCYACALAWIFLTVLYMLGVDVPKILIAALIGMSLTGIWEEFKKFNFKYFGLFTIFITVFGITLIYTLLIDYKFEFLLLVLVLFVMDGIIVLKNFEIKKISAEKEKFKKEIKKDEIKKEETGKKEEKEEEKKSLREMLDHCCD
ncbi:MAG: hypothetical protein CVT88_06520 [Candidatus Altiarchaeales archaeon HGW-Altiarchaeales-1]|nr:MAG: hypothetical protein CVT88_06520 [Candidatus Altiarchaeales archaeon HGW-Altiarchaeales-1]